MSRPPLVRLFCFFRTRQKHSDWGLMMPRWVFDCNVTGQFVQNWNRLTEALKSLRLERKGTWRGATNWFDCSMTGSGRPGDAGGQVAGSQGLIARWARVAGGALSKAGAEGAMLAAGERDEGGDLEALPKQIPSE